MEDKYKIICSQPKKGIERSLPYVLDAETANLLCESLNRWLTNKGYAHRVELTAPEPAKSTGTIRGRRAKR